MNTIDRRAFLGFSGGAAALTALPLSGCGGGGGDNFPPASLAGVGPVAVATDGRQFQTLATAHALAVTEKDGQKKFYGGVGTAQGKLNYPTGVAVLNGLAYVVETGNHRVQVFDAAGKTIGTIGKGVLLYPSAIAAGKSEIFVADARNARIVAFTPEGQLTRVLGEGILSAPRGMDVMSDGVLVADPGLRKVLKLGFDGGIAMEVGADWVLPWDVATDNEFIYVADVSREELGVTNMDGVRLGRIALASAPANVWFRADQLSFAANV